MKNKICRTCKFVKRISDFYSRKDSRDGFCHQCKKCLYLRTAENRKRSPEKLEKLRRDFYKKNRLLIIERSKRWQKNNKERRSIINCRFRRKNPEKIYKWSKRYKYPTRKTDPIKKMARNAVRAAIQSKNLKDPKALRCFKCNNNAREYHHESYNKENWLKVKPVCKKCHGIIHRKIKDLEAYQSH